MRLRLVTSFNNSSNRRWQKRAANRAAIQSPRGSANRP
jgi:hypothetical protein